MIDTKDNTADTAVASRPSTKTKADAATKSDVAVSTGIDSETEADTGAGTAEAKASGAKVSRSNWEQDFIALLKDIRKQFGYRLPSSALIELPQVLTEGTKAQLIMLKELSSGVDGVKGIETAGEILLEAIDKINHGSLETVDTTLRETIRATVAAVAVSSTNSVGFERSADSTGSERSLTHQG